MRVYRSVNSVEDDTNGSRFPLEFIDSKNEIEGRGHSNAH